MNDIETRLLIALEKAKIWLQQESPYKTGNLRYNAIKLRSIGNNTWELYVDEEIAPYMPFTNEPWISKIWRNKKNPNEDWWNTAIGHVMYYMSLELKGTLKKL